MNSREKEKEKKNLFYLFLLINNKNTELYEMILKKLLSRHLTKAK
jgi:hypothetical protein